MRQRRSAISRGKALAAANQDKVNLDLLPMFIAKPNYPKLIVDRDPSMILR
jgi:hypothetical protein